MNTGYKLLLVLLLLPLISTAQQRVLVGNEGNFGRGNASLTQYLVASKAASQDQFFEANNAEIGDVLQSMQIINGQLYLVANNSHKILVADSLTYDQEGVITFDQSGPREIVKAADGKAYVSNLNTGTLSIVDLSSFEITGSIEVGANPDKMLVHENHVYVSNWGFGNDSTIFKVDPMEDAVLDTFFVRKGPRSMVVDSRNRLWVICAGANDSDFQHIPGTSGLSAIDLATGETILTADIESPSEDIALHESSNSLFVNDGGVRRFDLETETFDADTLIKGNFYTMDLSDYDNPQFYLADAKGFAEGGEAFIYSLSGELQGSFATGIGPGSFLFLGGGKATAIESPFGQPQTVALAQNYPNPFNPSTTISFTLDQASHIQLMVYDMTGREVARLADGAMSGGSHAVTFDASHLATGVYIYRLIAGNQTLNRKMTLIK